jgi:hypothetical protein
MELKSILGYKNRLNVQKVKRVVASVLLFLILLFKLNRSNSFLNLVFIIWYFNPLMYSGAVCTA